MISNTIPRLISRSDLTCFEKLTVANLDYTTARQRNNKMGSNNNTEEL